MGIHTENSNAYHREEGRLPPVTPTAVGFDAFRQRFPYTLVVGSPSHQHYAGVVQAELQFSPELLTLLEMRVDSPILGRGRLAELVVLNLAPQAILAKESKLRFHSIPENYDLLPSVICNFTRMLSNESRVLRSEKIMQTLRERRTLSRFEAVCASLSSEYPNIGKLLVQPSAEALVSTIQWTKFVKSPNFKILEEFYGIGVSSWSENDTLYDQLYAGKSFQTGDKTDRSPRAVSCFRSPRMVQIDTWWDSRGLHMPISLDVTNLIRVTRA